MPRVIRTGIIEIDTRKKKLSPPPWVTGKVQYLEVDSETGEILSESAREGRIVRRLDQVAATMASVDDPVTGQTVQISLAAVGFAIEQYIAQWLLEDFDAHYDPELDAVVLNDAPTE